MQINNYSEALYNENRNAVPSWQGYEYQGKVAIRRYLEMLNDIFKSEKIEQQILNECQKILLKIEWLEDFTIFESENISEIYQVKKTLTKSEKEEVVANFILQYKLLGKSDIHWFIIFDELKEEGIDGRLSESDFKNIYKKVIEQEFEQEIKELKNNRDIDFWSENLSLRNKNSNCKNSRAYLRKLFELESAGNTKVEYRTKEQIDEICSKYLDVILDKCKKNADDYSDFSSRLKIIQIPIKTLNEDCVYYTKGIPKFIRCNQMLSEEDIFQKMLYDLKWKLEAIKDKKENFTYNFENIIKVCRDEINTKDKWHMRLFSIKEELLNEFVKSHCDDCMKSKDCKDCIYSEIKAWNMDTLIDAMNLEYPNFRVEEAEKAFENKISDYKIELMRNMIEFFKDECRTRENEIVSIKDDQYFMSNILRSSNTKNRILSNYWEHTRIYRDYDYILTGGLDYELDEENVSFLKEHYGEELRDSTTKEIVTFFDTRRTKFIDYEKVKI